MESFGRVTAAGTRAPRALGSSDAALTDAAALDPRALDALSWEELDSAFAEIIAAARESHEALSRAEAARACQARKALAFAEYRQQREAGENAPGQALPRTVHGTTGEMLRRATVAELACAFRETTALTERILTDAELVAHELPLTHKGFLQGGLSNRHARVITEAATSIHDDDRAHLDEELARLAHTMNPAELRRAARDLRDRLHPETLAEQHREAMIRRSLTLDPCGKGMAYLTLHGAAPELTAIHDRFDRYAAHLKREEHTRIKLARAAGTTPETPRTMAQLRYDAAAAMLLRGTVPGTMPVPGDTEPTAQAEGKGEPRLNLPPHIGGQVYVTVPADLLLGLKRITGKLAPGASTARVSDRVSLPTLHGYGVIDPETAKRLLARLGTFVTVITDPHTEAVLSIGRERHDAPPDLKRALQFQDQHCRFPGCLRHAERCDLDHVVDWQYGGSTAAHNLAHLCRSHHTLKHHGGWTVKIDEARTLTWRSPAGTTISTDPTVVARTRPRQEPSPPSSHPQPPSQAEAPAPAQTMQRRWVPDVPEPRAATATTTTETQAMPHSTARPRAVVRFQPVSAAQQAEQRPERQQTSTGSAESSAQGSWDETPPASVADIALRAVAARLRRVTRETPQPAPY